MRILGVKKKWDKLKEPSFTTFRFARKDKDWQLDEIVQIVYKPRSRGREVLGPAEIVGKGKRWFGAWDLPLGGGCFIGDSEARKDGFDNYAKMEEWFRKQYGGRIFREPINKLTLEWKPE